MSSTFVERYGAIYEHSPWVAECAADVVDESAPADAIVSVMADCVDNASEAAQLKLIRAHPDLAGKAQVAGELTAESTEEQQRAGLAHCSAEEYERFQSLNERYKARFGFPFVMAVRNSSRRDILEAFEARVDNDRALEFETALAEIHKIAAMRIVSLHEDRHDD